MEDSLVTGLRAPLQGRITYVNPRSARWWASRRKSCWATAPPPPPPAPYWPAERVEEYRQRQAHRFGRAACRHGRGLESEFMRKDGTRFPVLIIEAPLINAQGLHTGWMSAFLDISEQRRVEELSRASPGAPAATATLATVGEMASLLSHELNQPLAAISSYATGSLNLLESVSGDQPVPSSQGPGRRAHGHAPDCAPGRAGGPRHQERARLCAPPRSRPAAVPPSNSSRPSGRW